MRNAWTPPGGGNGGIGQPSATRFWASPEFAFGGSGGIGQPSATNVPASPEIAGGGNGGMGHPSATIVPLSLNNPGGGSGGMGHPSAFKVPWLGMSLLAGRLTNRTTGSTINIAIKETAASKSIFFKGVSLLACSMRRDSLEWVLCLKLFRMRNARWCELTQPIAAIPQSHSGLHTDDSRRHSRAIRPSGLHCLFT